MRYWKSLLNLERVIAVDVLMIPEKWIEITKDAFEKVRENSNNVERKA